MIRTDDEAKAAVALIGRLLLEEGALYEGVPDFAATRLAEMILKARRRALAIAERRNKLLPRGPLLEHVAKAFTGLRQTIQRMSSRHSAAMAAETRLRPGAALRGTRSHDPRNARGNVRARRSRLTP